jgi:peptide/nickel transport system substrate-binding protein
MAIGFRMLLALGAATIGYGCTSLGTTSTTAAHTTGAASVRGAMPQRTLRVAVSSSPNTLNPLLATQQVEVQLISLALEPLVATDPEGHDVPILAARVPTTENGDIARDGRAITYHLRHGVRWQDGAPFTSRDVAFSWRAIMNPKTAVATRHGYDRVDRVETPDPFTAIFRLKGPFAPAVHTFFAHSDSPIEIVPAHLLERYGDLNKIPFNSKPIGTGPYRIERWVRGERIDYVANERYYLGKPRIPKIVVHFVPDENTVVNQLRAHELDWFLQATPKTYPQLHAIAGYDVRLVRFNGADSIIFNTTHAPFSDARLRRAVGLAIDKAKLVDETTYGTTVPATEDIPSFMWAFNPHAGTDKRDLSGARALVAAAGYRIGSDGIGVRDDKRLAMGLAFRTDSITDRNRGVVIASMLHDVGIEVQLKGYTTALLYGPYSEHGILANGQYDASLETWYSGVDPDDSTQLLCRERPPNGYNWSRYCNPALDAAEQVALAHYDLSTRRRAYGDIQQILARDAPFVYLWWPRQIEAVSSDLAHFRPNGIVETWNAYQWSFGA